MKLFRHKYMIIRKNITLENDHIKKLEPFLKKNEGNLSAAIRDSIDMADFVLQQYGTFEKAKSSITTETKKLTEREQSIESGKKCPYCQPGIPVDVKMDERDSS